VFPKTKESGLLGVILGESGLVAGWRGKRIGWMGAVVESECARYRKLSEVEIINQNMVEMAGMYEVIWERRR
jgi:hypothetical protein